TGFYKTLLHDTIMDLLCQAREETMAHYKSYDRDQGYFVQLVPSEQFDEYSIEKVIDRFVEDNVSEELFGWKYSNDENGRKAIHPFLKLKIILYSYTRGLQTSREMEAMLKCGHMGYVFLSANTFMDHSTICGFIDNFSNEIEEIYSKLLALLDGLGVIDWSMLMIDGTKVSSNADKELTSDAKGFSKKMERYRQLSEKIVERCKRIDVAEQSGEMSSDIAEEERKRIERQKRKYESVMRKIEEYEQEVADGTRDEKEKVNLTDNESRLVKNNGTYIQGYNVQAVYCGNDVIVDIAAVSKSNDIELLAPHVEHIERVKEELGVKTESTFLADKGYCNPSHVTNLTAAGEKIYCAIPESMKSGWINDEKYHVGKEENDVIFSCCGGVKQKGYYDKKEDAYVFTIRKNKCSECEHINTCWDAKGTQTKRKFKVSSVFVDHKDAWKEYSAKMESCQGQYIYNKRIGKEHNFNDLKHHGGLYYIYRKGRDKATTIALLAGMAHNLKKLSRFMTIQGKNMKYCPL
nr:transposase [Spirochaetota bacterium]